MDELRSTLAGEGIGVSRFVVLDGSGAETIYLLPVPGAAAQRLWQQLRQLASRTGMWPVIVGRQSELDRHSDAIAEERDPEVTLRLGAEIDASRWIEEHLGEIRRTVEDDPEWEMPHGDWPKDMQPDNELSVPLDLLNRRAHAEVYITLLPCKHGWEAPAWLNFGGWNDCPYPEEHVAVLKRWEEVYGAEVACISADTVEMIVSRPPLTRADALALAEEQYAYAADTVDQGFDTLEALAASLLKGNVWWFWWD